MTSIVQRARLLEEAFLGGLEDAQTAYEEIVATQAWATLGYDSFAEWWQDRVVPAMRALSMRPTKEIAAAVVEQVREDEAALPPAQRRTQRELAEMVGAGTDAKFIRPRSAPAVNTATPDLEWDGNRIAEKPTTDPLPAGIAEQIDERISERTDPADERRDAELDAVMDGTEVRFRRNFANAAVKAGELTTFDPERIAEVYGHNNWQRNVADLLQTLRGWCDQVEQAHRNQQRAGLRVISGGQQ